jgi:hypothetical protein
MPFTKHFSKQSSSTISNPHYKDSTKVGKKVSAIDRRRTLTRIFLKLDEFGFLDEIPGRSLKQHREGTTK